MDWSLEFEFVVATLEFRVWVAIFEMAFLYYFVVAVTAFVTCYCPQLLKYRHSDLND